MYEERQRPACYSLPIFCFFPPSERGDQAGSGLKAPRSHARPEAKKRNQQGRAASVTGSDGIDTDSVKLGLLTAVALSHHQR
jgi:hypothetical protein